ncbi:MAG TPA: TrkH family potassium uptake protein [Planctomycetota bacterium]|nr:TrkH family potassium uptake protein [Planctomycetota bacterium]HRR79049.1 TrkH family potassium uptake protein [Planctomycetota bacterium]
MRLALDGVALVVTLGIGVALAVWAAAPMTREGHEWLRGLDVVVLVVFVAEVALRIALARARLEALGARWFDFFVLAALLQALGDEQATWPWFLVRQGLAALAWTLRRPAARRLLSRLWAHPAPLLVGSFAGAILLGAAVLALPIASATGASIGLLDALFTSTSAVCVTGLVVKDTGCDFTLFGQLVILWLIQLGGLGIMTFSVSMVLVLGRALAAMPGRAMRDMLDQQSAREAVHLVRFITVSTLAIEAVGAGALFCWFGASEGYTARCAYSAIFHSISAFCNAGFSLYGRSFEAYRSHVGVNLVLTSLIILGGLGFPVMRDLLVLGRRRRLGEGRSPGLRTQTRVVLTTSAILIVAGAALFYVLELPATLKDLRPGERVLASYFQSVTARTAGFNTVDIGSVRAPALVVLMALMYIGASPGSTGGGIKTTTAAILFQAMRSAFRRRPQVELFRRTVPRSTIRRSIALVTLTILLLIAATIALTAAEPELPFERVLFEAISAFGTVGLSTGITAALSMPGKLIIIVLMFAGRVGPLTLMFSLLGEGRPARYTYPQTHMMVG